MNIILVVANGVVRMRWHWMHSSAFKASQVVFTRCTAAVRVLFVFRSAFVVIHRISVKSRSPISWLSVGFGSLTNCSTINLIVRHIVIGAWIVTVPPNGATTTSFFVTFHCRRKSEPDRRPHSISVVEGRVSKVSRRRFRCYKLSNQLVPEHQLNQHSSSNELSFFSASGSKFLVKFFFDEIIGTGEHLSENQ
jgi:hypothetical protein